MNILVDTSTWLDFFKERTTDKAQAVSGYLHEGHLLCTCGFVLTEVFQGIRNSKEHWFVSQHFKSLLYLDDDRSTFELAATIYRELRRDGITIRKTMDCLIAAVAFQHSVPLLHNDRDFEFIARHYPLRLL